MYDRNSDNFNSLKETVKLVFFFKTIVGTILLLFGLSITYEVVQTIYSLINNPDEIRLVETILRMGQPNGEFINQLQSSELHQFMGGYEDAVIGYGILIILLSIVAGIATTLLSLGTKLIESDLKTLLEKLGEELARLWKDRDPNER